MIPQHDELVVSDITIDLTYLKKFSNGDRSFEKDMLESSLNEAEGKIMLLNVFLEKREYKKVKALSHSLKSLMYIMGAEKLHNHFNIMEHADEKTGFEETIKKQFDYIHNSWLILRRKVENLIEQYQLTL